MTNGTNAPTQHFNTETRYAELGERVTNLSQRQHDLEAEMRRGFGEVSQAVNLLSNEVRGSSRTQWPVIWSAIGVCFVVISAIGTLAFVPMRADVARIDNDVKALMVAIREVDDKNVNQNQFTEFKNTYESNRALSRIDYNDKFKSLNDEISATVPRAEHERVWNAYDQRFMDIQRQVDEVKQAQGSVYGTRDLLIDLRNRLDRVESDKGVAPR